MIREQLRTVPSSRPFNFRESAVRVTMIRDGIETVSAFSDISHEMENFCGSITEFTPVCLDFG
jgi:hypothetical protein